MVYRYFQMYKDNKADFLYSVSYWSISIYRKFGPFELLTSPKPSIKLKSTNQEPETWVNDSRFAISWCNIQRSIKVNINFVSTACNSIIKSSSNKSPRCPWCFSPLLAPSMVIRTRAPESFILSARAPRLTLLIPKLVKISIPEPKSLFLISRLQKFE